MKAATISLLRKPILTHAATALVTLAVCLILTGDRLVSKPLQAQVSGRQLSRQPFGREASQEAPAAIEPRARATTPTPPPPQDLLRDLDPDERNNVRVYAAANKGVVNVNTEAEVAGFFGDDTSTGTAS